ncbi:MAG: hypothetical protein IT462_11285 [Planctomycetes bacterium]|nr:hypothetical protein [Planctomycetota bacterium]
MKIRTDLVRKNIRVLPAAEATSWAESAKQVIQLQLKDFEVTDTLRLALGEYAPLEGFLTEADYEAVTRRYQLADGTPWDLPVVLAVDDETRAAISRGHIVALVDRRNNLVGRLEVRSIYRGNSGRWLVGGPVDVVPSALEARAKATRSFKDRLIDYASALGAVAG